MSTNTGELRGIWSTSRSSVVVAILDVVGFESGELVMRVLEFIVVLRASSYH